MAGIVTLAISYVLSQFYRSFLAVLTPALTAEIGATNTQLSIASGTWFIVFALAQFPVGIWLDRFGPRWTSAVLLGLCASAGAVLLTLATAPWMIIASMGLIGLGCAPVLMAAVFIFAKNYSPGRLAVLSSWVMGIGILGSVIGTAPLAAAAQIFGWRSVMLGFAAVTLLAGICILAFVKDPPHEPVRVGDNILRGYLELFRLRPLWLIMPMMTVTTVPSQAIRGLWAGPFLSDVYHADALLIGQVTLFMALALAAGAFISGPLDTILRTRKWIVAGGVFISVVILVSLAIAPQRSLGQLITILVLLAFCGGTYAVLLTHAKAFMPAHLIGRGVTLMNFFSIGSVGLTQVISGGIFHAAAAPADPAWGYQVLFIFFAVMASSGLLIYLFSKDAKPEKRKDTIVEVAESR